MPLPRLVVLDMDGTLVDVESSWAAVHHHYGDRNEEGLRRFLAGEIDDMEFIRTDLRIWRRHHPELTLGELNAILDEVPLMPGARDLLAAIRERGISTAIISGGIDLLAERLGRELRIDRTLANGFVTDARGRLTGEGVVRVPVYSKEAVLRSLQLELGVAPEETAAVGNSEIDVGLFRRSRIGVAFRPEDDIVRRAATHVLERGTLADVIPIVLADGGAGARASSAGARKE